MAGKSIFGTDEAEVIRIHFNDEVTAFSGIKRASIKDKGICNRCISAIAFRALEEAGIPTHFISESGDRDMLCRKVEPLPIQVIVRNRISGTTAKMLGVENGMRIPNTIMELSYRRKELGKPMINDHHAVALSLATYDELKTMYDVSSKANEVLRELFHKAGIELVDIKLRFGKTAGGDVIIADEISPDNCRLWDEKDGRVLDKDRFRHDMSDVTASYREVMDRLIKSNAK